MSAAAAGVGVALTAGAAIAQADDGGATQRDPNGATPAAGQESSGVASPPAGPRRRHPGANAATTATSATRISGNKTTTSGISAPQIAVGNDAFPSRLDQVPPAATEPANTDPVDLPTVSVPAPVAYVSVAAPTPRFGTAYPAPVTAPVTVRAIVADTLNWMGFSGLTSNLPVPAAPVPDLVGGLWVELRKLHYTLFNAYPTLSQSAPVQDPVTGVLTGRVVGSDADRDALTYHVSSASHGTVVMAPDGSYSYTPDAGYTGADSFSVSVEDVTGNPAHLYGGAGLVHSLLDHYAPGSFTNADTMIVTVNTADAVGAYNPNYPCKTICNQGPAIALLAHYTPEYPSPVSDPVTVRSFAIDTLSWLGMPDLGRSLPIPAAPVGPVLSTVWEAVRKLHHTFFNSYPTLSAGAQTQDPTTGAITGTLVGSDVDQNALTYHVGSAAHGTVVLAPDGTYTYTPDETLGHLGGTDTFVASVEDVSANPFHYFGGWDIIHTLLEHVTPFGLGNPDTKIITVHVAPGTINTAPVISAATLATPSATTGAVAGGLAVADAEGDAMAFSIHATASAGALTVDAASGQFVYTPNAAARHSAAAFGSTVTDTFTIAATDAYGATTLHTVTVVVDPANSTPVLGTTSLSAASTVNGSIAGTLTATDADGDTTALTAVTTPSHGTLSITDAGTGTFTYTPTAEARHMAAAGQLTDTFTLAVDDGHGGIATRTITVAVDPANNPPVLGATIVASANHTDGSVSGTLPATDPDGDVTVLTAVTAPSLGTLTITNPATGAFVYTPTPAARQLPGQVTDTFTLAVTDGHGGIATRTITVAVDRANDAPVLSTPAFSTPNGGTGATTVTVTASDPNGDATTVAITAGPTLGTLVAGQGAGQYVYTPTPAARHNSGLNPLTDTFTLTATDSNGASVQRTVTVAVDPIMVNTAPTATVSVGSTFSNGDFTNNLTGWTAINSRVVLGTTSVAGWTSPTDPTTAPDGGVEATGSPSGTYTSTVSGGRAVLTSNLNGVINTPTGSGGVVHGPVIVSDSPVYIGSGATVSFDWEASGGADAYDVLAYMLNVNTGATYIMLNATGANAAATQAVTTVTFPVAVSGSYKFVFVSGSWDATRGSAAGARLSIDNVQVLNNSAVGVTRGAVSASDVDHDTLTYTVTTQPTNGSVALDAGTGVFTYTAANPMNPAADAFTITVDDGFGGTVVLPVNV